MLLITGLPRSGTVWAREALIACGFHCRSEHVYGLKQRSWIARNTAESSWLAVPFVAEVPMPIVRLVRDPALVLASVMGRDMLVRDDEFGAYRRFVESHLPSIQDHEDHLERAVHFVARWESPLQRVDHWLVRIEDPSAASMLVAATGFDREVDDHAIRAKLGSKVNTRPSRYRPSLDEVAATPDGKAFLERRAALGYHDWPW